jgi:ribosomal protein S18 acetylase RimI-like enzyme
MKFSKMTIEDYNEVYALWKNTPGMGLNNLDDSREGIDRYLNRNPNTCFVARENGKLVGVILSGHDGRRGFIHHTAVAVSERKKGIGRKLVEFALSALRAEGINKVAFVVLKSNEMGNMFWERLGFEKREDLVYRNKAITDVEMKKISVG